MLFISANLAIEKHVNFSQRSQDTNCATFRSWLGQNITQTALLIGTPTCMLIRKNSFITQFSNCSCHNVSFFYQTYKISSQIGITHRPTKYTITMLLYRKPNFLDFCEGTCHYFITEAKHWVCWYFIWYIVYSWCSINLCKR